MRDKTAARTAILSKAHQWIMGGDTGRSSLTIWGVMMSAPAERPLIPADPSDFGRCFRLLELIPEWRKRLPRVSDIYPEWDGLVQHWPELEALWQEERSQGRAPKLYQRMIELRKASL